MGLTDEQYRKVMRKGWNLTPGIYDRVWTPVLSRHSAACVERLRLKPTDRVLDVATGPGTAALLAAEHVPEGSVHGVDISDHFVDQSAHDPFLHAHVTLGMIPDGFEIFRQLLELGQVRNL